MTFGRSRTANALGHIVCQRGHSVFMARADDLLKKLRGARLDQTHEKELRRLIRVDLIIIDAFALDQMDATASEDIYELVVERHRSGSIIVTSVPDPQEWLAMMPDPLRPHSAFDRLQNAAYELLVEGESSTSDGSHGSSRSQGAHEVAPTDRPGYDSMLNRGTERKEAISRSL